jgi:hypothetical protein
LVVLEVFVICERLRDQEAPVNARLEVSRKN